MSEINVISRTQRIIVVPESSSVSVISTGPAGPPGPAGPTGSAGQAAGKILYLINSDASDIATYKTLYESPGPGAETTLSTPCTGTNVDTLVASFATDPNIPGAVDFPAGTSYRRIYANVQAGTARFHLMVYKRNAAGVETLIRDEFSTNFTNQTVESIEWMSTSAAAGAMLATDRIVGKLYAQRVTGPTTVTVTTYYEGSAHTSQVQTTISAGAQGPAGPPAPPWHDWSTTNGDLSSAIGAVVSSGGGNWGTTPPNQARVQNTATNVRASIRIAAGATAAMNAGTMRINLPRSCKFTSGVPVPVGTGFYMNGGTTVFCPVNVVAISATQAEMYYTATHLGTILAVTAAAPHAFTTGTTVGLDLDYEPA